MQAVYAKVDPSVSPFLANDIVNFGTKCQIHIVDPAIHSRFLKVFLLSTKVFQEIENIKHSNGFATAQEDSLNKMWSPYMKEAEEYDKLVTDVWKKDTNGVLIFVSLNPHILYAHFSDDIERPPFSLQP